MCPALVKVTFWDDGSMKEDITLLYGKNFTEIMRQVEDYYGDQLENVYIEIFEDGCRWHITDDMIPDMKGMVL